MKEIRRNKGFTVVELAIVLTVLGILVALTAVGYRSTQDKARSADITTALRAVESAMHATALNLNRETWPVATDFQGSSIANLSSFLAPEYEPDADELLVAGMRRELPRGIPQIHGSDEIAWTYRNNGSTRATSACDQNYTGALLVLTGVPRRVFDKVDSDFDDGNTLCGKVRYTDSGDLLYQVGFAPAIQN